MDQQDLNDQDFNDSYQDDFDHILPDESISQIFSEMQSEIIDINDSAASSNVSRRSSVWNHFDGNP